MIKLGPLAQQAINKEFPDNWKTLAIMLNVPFTMYPESEEDQKLQPDDVSIEIEFSDTKILTINADNSIGTTASLSNDVIGQLLVEIAQ